MWFRVYERDGKSLIQKNRFFAVSQKQYTQIDANTGASLQRISAIVRVNDLNFAFGIPFNELDFLIENNEHIIQQECCAFTKYKIISVVQENRQFVKITGVIAND